MKKRTYIYLSLAIILLVMLLVSLVYATTISTAGRIAFASNRTGFMKIYIMNADGSRVTQITSGNYDDFNPVWSPDDQKIAFVSNRDGNYEIYTMHADGTNQTRLTWDTINTYFDGQPSWSSDGTQIVFTSDRSGTRQIYVMNQFGIIQNQITNSGSNYDPCWSPNGSNQIAFTSTRDNNEELYIMDSNGNNQTRVTFNTGVDECSPVWAPDASLLAYVRDGHIFTINPTPHASGSQRTFNYATDYKPSWSYDGSTIAFTMDQNGNTDIHAVLKDNNNGTNPLPGLTNTIFSDQDPSWSHSPALPTSTELTGLSLNNRMLVPPFSSTTYTYTANVGYDTNVITVTATAEDSRATIKVNGMPVVSGQPSASIALNVGYDNTITVEVTPYIGNPLNYTITVARASSPYLSGLVLKAGRVVIPLAPPFNSTTLCYNSYVNGALGITVIPSAEDSNAVIKVNGIVVASGVPSVVSLIPGNNIITIEVTSTLGADEKTYTVTVTM